MIHRRPTSIAALCMLVTALTGCGGAGGPHDTTEVLPADFASWSPDRDAFLPFRLRVHPLTRITREAAGGEVLICHIELRDAFGQVVKCPGLAQVGLLAADAHGTPRDESAEPERVWQVDLREPDANAAAFDDVVTRTYALHLGSLPAPLARLADTPDAGGKDDADRPWYALRVRFLFKDAAGKGRQLEAIAPLLAP